MVPSRNRTSPSTDDQCAPHEGRPTPTQKNANPVFSSSPRATNRTALSLSLLLSKMASSKPTDDNTTSSKILPDEDVDELILQWLQKRKLTDSLDVLRLELESRGERGSSARSFKRSKHFASLDADLLENGLLVSISNPEGSASAYATQFRQLSTWIVNSLDEYKEQLNQLLYPTFVYAYVTMIQLEADTAAQELLAESKDLFLNQTSNSARREVLLKEIHEFSKIKTPEDFDSFENDVLGQKVRIRNGTCGGGDHGGGERVGIGCHGYGVCHALSRLTHSLRSQRCRRHQVAVTLSRYTYELLMQYLRQEQLVLMSSLLNRWFRIGVVQDFDADTMLGFWTASANVVKVADGVEGVEHKAKGKASKVSNATTITSKQLEVRAMVVVVVVVVAVVFVVDGLTGWGSNEFVCWPRSLCAFPPTHPPTHPPQLLKDSPYLKFQEIVLRERIRRFEERVAGIEEDTKEHKEAVRKLDGMRGTLGKLGEKGIGRSDGAVPLPKRSALLENWQEMEDHVGKWLDVVDGGASGGGAAGAGAGGAGVSALSAPPCAFATMLNSHESLNAVGMSSDFTTLVGGFADSVVRLYDLVDPDNAVTCLYGHTGPVYAVDMYKDTAKDTNGGTYESNPLVISGSGDGSVRLWSAVRCLLFVVCCWGGG